MLIDSYPYLVFEGRAEEAINYYADILSADILDLTKFSDMPEDPERDPVPESIQDRIMNATLQLPNGSYLMLSDNFPGMPYVVGNNITVTLVFDNIEETRDVFDKLKQGGKVNMELQETFWSPLYGQTTDKFGVEWMLSTLAVDIT
ncbi:MULTISPECIES: VOC family protein [unclassified Jeotgalibaca]|uniref:VOC family protein n=1 Tax=unclassified Jeotgalibaca TaxID=2621505 RepID=UPI003FD5369F